MRKPSKPILALIATVLAGCGSSMSGADAGRQSGTGGNPSTGTGGQPGSGGAAGMDGAGGGGATPGGGAPVPTAQCLEHPTARATAAAPVTVKVAFSYAGTPVTFGEPFPIEAGTLTMTNFRFYVSNVALRLRSGGEVSVDLVGGDGAPAPYGVVLVNAEDPSAMSFQLAAPAGDYTGLSFLVGIPDVCNGADNGRRPPLSATSQMTWPLPFGYLFLRYAGRRGDATPAGATPGAIDMGGFPGHILAPRVETATDLKIEGARTVQLTVALDELFRAVSLPADLDEYGQILGTIPDLGTAQLNGQHVLQNLGAVAAFTVTDLP